MPSKSNSQHENGSDSDRVHVLLVGEYQHGKSTLGKLLFPQSGFVTGEGWKPTTQTLCETISTCLSVSAWDSPGNNANAEHSAELSQGIEKADIAVFVKMCARDFSSTEIDLLVRLQQRRLPVALVFNCVADSAAALPADPFAAESHEVLESMYCGLQVNGIEPSQKFVVNLGWAAVSRDDAHQDFKKIIRSYTDVYPDDEALALAMQRSRVPELRKFLLEPGPHVFDQEGLLRHALLGRLSNLFRRLSFSTGRPL